MSVTVVWLPWLPIVLAVGVGGRLLGRRQGIGLGSICAVFWVLLIQASAGVGVWWNPLTAVALLAGAGAIIAIGAWSGDVRSGPESYAGTAGQDTEGEQPPALATSSTSDTHELVGAMQSFEDWLEEHRGEAEPWQAFDEFIRMTLRKACGARHVKPFCLRSDVGGLVPLKGLDPHADDHHLSARIGIIGHVVTSGRAYLAGDVTQGALVAELAAETTQPVAWCFAIKQGSQRFGAVVVYELDEPVDRIKPRLLVLEKLVNVWWMALREVCISREAVSTDPISGLHTRESFMRRAERALAKSYKRGEPVALAVIAVERLRELNDHGRWDTADELIGEVGKVLRRKVRADDALGRFDESRFIVLLRRVDSELASLIVKQILSQMQAVCQDTARWGNSFPVRCGLAGSGTEEPRVQDLLSRALQHCRTARTHDELCEDDLATGKVHDGAVR